MNQDRHLNPKNEESIEHRNWAMACHLSSLAILLLLPFANILGPLIVWLIKKDQMPLVDNQGKEALNFQITLTIGYFICVILMFFFVGLLLLMILGFYGFVMTLVAAIKSNNGEYYRYPICLRLIK